MASIFKERFRNVIRRKIRSVIREVRRLDSPLERGETYYYLLNILGNVETRGVDVDSFFSLANKSYNPRSIY